MATANSSRKSEPHQIKCQTQSVSHKVFKSVDFHTESVEVRCLSSFYCFFRVLLLLCCVVIASISLFARPRCPRFLNPFTLIFSISKSSSHNLLTFNRHFLYETKRKEKKKTKGKRKCPQMIQ